MLPEQAKDILKRSEGKMQDAVQYFEEELKTYRVGKANPAILSGINVDYYGMSTPLAQVASVSTPDASTILVQPWERNMISKIEKVLIDANLGFTPQNNGETIRCPIPPLTEERRRELIKKARATGENVKIIIRNARRDAVDLLKKAQKNEGLNEDAEKEGEGEIQKITDRFVKMVDELIAKKEKEILTV